MGHILPISNAQDAITLDPNKQISQYVHQTWNTDDGLPQNSVSAIVQTQNGYLWLGTEEGLVRFDGTDFKTFDKLSTPAFAVNDVVDLLIDQNDNLYAGTRGGGVVIFDGHTFSSLTVDDGLGSNFITHLSEDSEGNIWISAYGGGLSRLSEGKIETFGVDAGFEGDFISDAIQDQEGRHWIATEIGLLKFHDDKFERIGGTVVDSLFITTLFEDKAGKLWVATRNNGVFNLANDSLWQVIDPNAAQGYATSIIQDSMGSIWLSMTRGSLHRVTADPSATQTSRQITESDVLALFQDREGSLWVGTRGDGLHRLRNEKFTPFGIAEGITNERVYSIYEQEALGTWIGTAAGLFLIKNDQVVGYPQSELFAGKEILTIYGDEGPGIWIGTYGEGLFYLHDTTFRQFTTTEGLISNNIFTLQTDANNQLWIGTDAGISIFNGTAFSTVNVEQGIPSNFITAIEPSLDGAMWVGTYDAGLVRLDDGRVTTYNTEKGLSANGVLSLYEDVEGVLWIGTYGGGLNRLELNQITSFTTREGLFNDNVYVILEDNQHHLWMTCNKGVFKVDKRQLKEIARGSTTRITSTAYGKNDGLRSAEATGGQQPAGWKTADGRLWFPTIAGLTVVDPKNMPRNPLPPPVIIEAFVVDDTLQSSAEAITLAAGADKLRFKFTATSLIIPDQVQYQYILEGIDNHWSTPSTRQEAFYTNLPPGQYRFRVKAANNDGVWNQQGADIGFDLAPHFYQTIWFRSSIMLLMLALGFLAYRMRVQQLKARQEELERVVEERTSDLRREKEITEKSKRVIEAQAEKLKELDRFKTRFFANISHEFRTPLTMIIGPLENALSGLYGPIEHTLKRQVGIMLRNAQRLLRLINQLLDLSKLEAGKMELRAQRRNVVQFLESVLLSCTPLADKKDIKLNFESSSPEIELLYEPDKFEKVFFNLLSNALKFTPEGGTITFTVDTKEPTEVFTQGAAEIRVKDTGRGIPPENLPHIFDRFHQVDGSNTREHEGSGIGLALVHELIMLHHGSIEVKSEVGAGTEFIVQIPLGDKHLSSEQITADVLGDDLLNPSSTGVITELATESMDFDHEQKKKALDNPYNGPDPMIGAKLVLIVDDNHDVREYVSGILSEHYVVHTAVDGIDGLEKVASLNPDLVISDVMMPRMDGNELCQRIKQNLDYDHIPVILMTARATNELKIEGLEMGADDYIAKPFNARELLVRARNLMVIRHQEKQLKGLNESLEQKVADQLTQMLSERLKYEEELVQAKEKAEASSRLKSNILDNVNHEFRTPLAGIIGSAEILEMDVADPLQEFVGFIKQSAYRLQSTLDAVVDLSALESENINLDLEVVDFVKVLEDSVSRLKPVAIRKGLQFYAQLENKAAPILADERALENVLDHLIDNAVKFTHDGKIQIAIDQDADHVTMTLQDTGIGIASEFMPKLFDAFVQESDGISRSYEGIGIGLTIAHKLIEQMDGSLELESQKNEGTTVTLSFPMYNAEKSERDTADSEPQAP